MVWRTHQVKSLLALAYLREDLFDLLERAHVASLPLDLRILTTLFLDLLDSLFTLLFFAVDHDYPGAVLHECLGDLETALQLVIWCPSKPS
jgi:hypothetical protein